MIAGEMERDAETLDVRISSDVRHIDVVVADVVRLAESWEYSRKHLALNLPVALTEAPAEPDVVDAVESKGWDLDYYMTCVYERHRSEEALKKLLGHVPMPVGEVYLREDPPRMFQAMRQTKRPCNRLATRPNPAHNRAKSFTFP